MSRAGGLALALIAQLAMGDSWRTGVHPATCTDLVTNGVFGSVRNPTFAAMTVATAGLVLLVPNPVSAAALLVLVAALEIQVRLVEEPYLRALHGPVYEAYLSSAGRFVPGVGLGPAVR